MGEKKKEKVIPSYGKDEVKAPCAILLWSSLASNAHQNSAQTKMMNLLVAQKIRCEQLDGAQGENKVLRNKLFNCSNVRGKYPQIFIKNEKGELKYIGNDEEVQYMVDAETFVKA